MTEYEKMIAGMLYNAGDPELLAMRRRIRDFAVAYNQTKSEEEDLRVAMLEDHLGAFGEESWIEPDIRLDYGINLHIGKHCYFNFDCVFLDVAPITIGDYVLVGPNVSFYTPLHPMDWRLRRNYYDENGELATNESAAPIVVGDDVWIGGGAIILAGVTIGARSVIGAGSVVTRDIPADVFAAGNPCRVIRKLGEEDREAFPVR